jgi:hypothetical protein
VHWYTPYDYWYLFQCKLCPEEVSGRLKAEIEYIPFWEEAEKPILAPVPMKRARRITEE